MSLKRFRIEQLCQSIDRMISLVFGHYAIMYGQEKKSCVSGDPTDPTKRPPTEKLSN